MTYDIQLQFVQDLLSEMHISSHFISDPNKTISCNIDLGLRSLLFDVQNYTNFFHNSMYQAQHNTIYRFFDEYYCNYIFFRLPNSLEQSFFFIGPYLLELPSEEKVKQMVMQKNLSDALGKQLLKYYTRLPIVEDENILFTITNTLGKSLWGTPDTFTIEYLDYMIPDKSDPISVPSEQFDFSESPFTLDMLEENARNEKYLMDAVSQGKLNILNVPAASVFNNGTEQRLSDSLRNRKNYLIILNTLLRKAAEQGGVDLLHIDRTSSSFAHKIETIHSIHESLRLQEHMIRSYCLLVKNYSLSKHSSLIAKAITLIYYDLTADLSLNNLSAQLNVNASYLSALFKKECGCTLTQYVNTKRMEHAISLLNTTDKLIQTISYECGFQDVNYFIKLFKKHTSLTPTQYKEQIGK